MYTVITSNKCQIAFCYYEKVNEEGVSLYYNLEKLSPNSSTLSKEFCLRLFYGNNNYFWTGAIMYEKKLLLQNRILFSEKFRYCEDQEFMAKAIYHSQQISYVDEVLAYYLQRPTSAVNKINPVAIRDNIRAYRSLGHYFFTVGDSRMSKYVKNTKIPQKLEHVLTLYAIEKDKTHYRSLLYRKSIKHSLLMYILRYWWDYKRTLKYLALCFMPEIYYNHYSKYKDK